MRRFGLSTAKLNFYEKNPFIFSRKCRGAQTLSFSHRVVYFRSVLQPDQGNKYHIRSLILQGHASLRRFPCSAKPTSPHAQCAVRLQAGMEAALQRSTERKKEDPRRRKHILSPGVSYIIPVVPAASASSSGETACRIPPPRHRKRNNRRGFCTRPSLRQGSPP